MLINWLDILCFDNNRNEHFLFYSSIVQYSTWQGIKIISIKNYLFRSIIIINGIHGMLPYVLSKDNKFYYHVHKIA